MTIACKAEIIEDFAKPCIGPNSAFSGFGLKICVLKRVRDDLRKNFTHKNGTLFPLKNKFLIQTTDH